MIQNTSEQDIRTGIWYALAAYGLWGLAPVYFKWLDGVAATEILIHRVIWSVAVLVVLLAVMGSWSAIRTVFRQPKVLAGLTLSAAIISINWLTFIWAVGQGRILESSLGYFMNPLVSIFLGMIFLSERLRPWQWLAIFLAGAGVAWQLILHGSLPWVALVLAFSFGFYGLLRKQIPVDAISGLFIETVIMFPAAIIWLLWLLDSQQLSFGHTDLETDLLLMAAGLVTSIPLLFFAGAARRLSLTLVGFIQYMAPSITFLLAVLVYGEDLGEGKLATFVLIWLALLVFTMEGAIQKRRRNRLAQSSC
ncbi:EamA family transporter RarD [Oceanospirillum sediminis]|uniref:EamA family transporter RarD n=1 Tax=Oceanospirillum sediminis TaxID=2760088 RepID=A0A839IRV2_9GAMM|nr:EamA family transporter RarD [Oceanospirillum sediminis]MBB1486926.1 EamA family transporter RarD [Oceanospirillum sediminis]